MTKKQFPMTPEQIRALRQIFQATQRASVAPIETPTPTVSTQFVSLAPGSQPPIVKLATGFVTSVVFLDETGQPWPIADYSIGKPTAFSIQWDNNTNVLMIQGTGPYESGNMALRLAGLPTPVMLTLVSDQQKVDYRIDLRIQGRGPNAKAPIIREAIPHSPNSQLMELLDGVPPLGNTRLTVVGGPAEAWLAGDRLLIRTRLTILSPEWTATMSSADGTRVYELNPTPLILASREGQSVSLKIEGL
jgi:intracellular multiplication protein IcmK